MKNEVKNEMVYEKIVSFPSVMVVSLLDRWSVETHCRTTTITSGAFGTANLPSSHSVTEHNNFA